MQNVLLGNELPDLVSVPEAAKYLGVGRKIIYQLLEYGEYYMLSDREVKSLLIPVL